MELSMQAGLHACMTSLSLSYAWVPKTPCPRAWNSDAAGLYVFGPYTCLQLTSSADIAAAYAPQMTSIQLVNTPENASIGCLHPLVCTFTELRQLSLVGTRLVHIPYSLPALQKLEVSSRSEM